MGSRSIVVMLSRVVSCAMRVVFVLTCPSVPPCKTWAKTLASCRDLKAEEIFRRDSMAQC